MYQYFIAIASCYQLGKRIAWHHSDHKISPEQLIKFRDKSLELNCTNYSIHKLKTDSKDWDSVTQKDSFFMDLVVLSLDDFFKELRLDKQITALDVAKYLLASMPMTNLKLQKMIYFVYADYLLKTGKRLFEDDIKALQYGPVVPAVYEHYKENGRSEIQLDEIEITSTKISKPMVTAKMLQSDDGVRILDSIESTLKKLGHKTAGQLVNITHAKGTPWDNTSSYYVITDEMIKKYHPIEIFHI